MNMKRINSNSVSDMLHLFAPKNALTLALITFYLATVFAAGQNAANAPSGRQPAIVEHPEDVSAVRSESATLNCRAEGDPTPTITWYKDGKPVTTSREVQNSNRVIVSTGLMFLTIDARNDPGTYYCNATNSLGWAVSQNATLQLAMLRDEFRAVPESTKVSVDEVLVLNCRAPNGRPEPTIKWKKNGEWLTEGGRVHIRDGGTLSIANVRKSDAGSYVCVAENVAGTRETRAAVVQVFEKPKFLKWPSDETVVEEEDVTLECRVTGDPQPIVIWKRSDDQQIPTDRSRITDRGLQILQLHASDDGVYVCSAHNEVGTIEANARLTVHTNPTFSVTPTDKTVPVGASVQFVCNVVGQPAPAVYWSREKEQNLMFPTQNVADGRFIVSPDGTLEITRVEKADEGMFICHALSVTGRAQAHVRLTVEGTLINLPPIIEYGPQNQTLPRGAVAILPCTNSLTNMLSAADSSEWTVRYAWTKDGQTLNAATQQSSSSQQRYTVLASGTLQISDVQQSDAGAYTCALTNAGGTTAWTAHLIVHEFDASFVSGSNRPAPRQFSLAALPAAPLKPLFAEVTRESVTLIIQMPSQTDGSSSQSASGSGSVQFKSEYFSPQFEEKSWKPVVLVPIARDRYIVAGLRPDFTYYFIVRAVNSFGIGAASPVSDPVRTGERPAEPPAVDPTKVAEKLSKTQVTNLDKDVVESTSIKLSWQVNKNFAYIDTFYVRVAALNRLTGEREVEREVVQRTPVTKESPKASCVIDNLRPNTSYEVRVQTGSHGQRGPLSAPITVRTREAAPTGTPQNMSISWLANDQLVIQWSAPPIDEQNGVIVSYRGRLICIRSPAASSRPAGVTPGAAANEQLADAIVGGVTCDDSRLSPRFSTDLTRVTLSNLDKSARYVLEIAAGTRAGFGRYSDALLVEEDRLTAVPLDSYPFPDIIDREGLAPNDADSLLSTESPELVRKPWFIAALVGTIGGVVWIGLCILFVYLYRRRCRAPSSKTAYLLSSNSANDAGGSAEAAKADAKARYPLLQKGDIVTTDIIEQQQRAAQKTSLMTPSLITKATHGHVSTTLSNGQPTSTLSSAAFANAAAQQQALMNSGAYGIENYPLSCFANNMNIVDSSTHSPMMSAFGSSTNGNTSAQLRSYIDAQTGLPTIVPIPVPPQSASQVQAQNQAAGLGPYASTALLQSAANNTMQNPLLSASGIQNGMLINSNLFRPIGMHSSQMSSDAYDSETYAPLLPIGQPQGMITVDVAQAGQQQVTAPKSAGAGRTKRNSSAQKASKTGTKKNSSGTGNASSSSSSTHINVNKVANGNGQQMMVIPTTAQQQAAMRSSASSSSNPQAQHLHVNDFLPPPPTCDPQALSPNSVMNGVASSDILDTDPTGAQQNGAHMNANRLSGQSPSSSSRFSQCSSMMQPMSANESTSAYNAYDQNAMLGGGFLQFDRNCQSSFPSVLSELEHAKSNPLHYQSTTSRGSGSSAQTSGQSAMPTNTLPPGASAGMFTNSAGQPVAARVEVTPYGPQLMLSVMGNNGQMMSMQWPAAGTYPYALPSGGETTCTTELEEVGSEEDGEEENEDDDGGQDGEQYVEDDFDETDGADGRNAAAMQGGESDASFMIEADFNNALKRAAELTAAIQSGVAQQRSGEAQMMQAAGANTSSTLPHRRRTTAMSSALPQVLENHSLQQSPAHYPYGAAGNYQFMQPGAYTMQQRPISPYSSDNSTYGIVLPTKPGPNLLLPANGQQQSRPPRKRRVPNSGSQKLSSSSSNKESPTSAKQTDVNSNTNTHVHSMVTSQHA